MGGTDGVSDEIRESMSPRWIALIATWLCSEQAQNVTGRVFDIRGDKLGIAEGWHLGPSETQGDEPSKIINLFAVYGVANLICFLSSV